MSGSGPSTAAQEPLRTVPAVRCGRAKFAAGVGLGAGAAWAIAGGGEVQGALLWLAAAALLWLGGSRLGARSRFVSPALAFFVVVALLGAVFHVTAGALP